MKKDYKAALMKAAEKLPGGASEDEKVALVADVIKTYERAKNPPIIKRWQVRVSKFEEYYVEVEAESRDEAKALGLLEETNKKHHGFYTKCFAIPTGVVS